MSKTTKQDFDLFVKECRKWIDRLNLNDIEVEYRHERLSSDTVLATTQHLFKAQIAVISLNTDIDVIKSRQKLLKNTAFHEVLHLLLFNLGHLAEGRGWDYVNYDMEVHKVIHRLQKAME